MNEDKSIIDGFGIVAADVSGPPPAMRDQSATSDEGEPRDEIATGAPASSLEVSDAQLVVAPQAPAELPVPPEGVTQTSPHAAAPEEAAHPQVDDRAELRARLTRRFEAWLDTMLQDEPPPRGIPDALIEELSSDTGSAPAGNEADLYTLFAALTSLTGEIRLQGRAFKNLTDTLTPLSETPAQLRELQEAQRDATADILDALPPIDSAPQIPTAEACEVLIDLYDRLARGLQTCAAGIRSIEAAQRQTWLWRLAGGPAFAQQAAATARALQNASALTLARLQSAMQTWHIHRLGTVGETFDPQRMTVVDARIDPASPPGTVVEVIRSGYALNGELRSVARVAVAKG